MKTIVDKIDRLLHGNTSPEEALEVVVAVATDETVRAEFVWSLNFIESLRMAMPDHIESANDEVKASVQQIINRA